MLGAAIELQRASGDRINEARSLSDLGVCYLEARRNDEAGAHLAPLLGNAAKKMRGLRVEVKDADDVHGSIVASAYLDSDGCMDAGLEEGRSTGCASTRASRSMDAPCG